MNFLGVVGIFSCGFIEMAAFKFIPLMQTHAGPHLLALGIGLIFSAIFFLSFRGLSLPFDLNPRDRGPYCQQHGALAPDGRRRRQKAWRYLLLRHRRYTRLARSQTCPRAPRGRARPFPPIPTRRLHRQFARLSPTATKPLSARGAPAAASIPSCSSCRGLASCASRAVTPISRSLKSRLASAPNGPESGPYLTPQCGNMLSA